MKNKVNSKANKPAKVAVQKTKKQVRAVVVTDRQVFRYIEINGKENAQKTIDELGDVIIPNKKVETMLGKLVCYDEKNRGRSFEAIAKKMDIAKDTVVEWVKQVKEFKTP